MANKNSWQFENIASVEHAGTHLILGQNNTGALRRMDYSAFISWIKAQVGETSVEDTENFDRDELDNTYVLDFNSLDAQSLFNGYGNLNVIFKNVSLPIDFEVVIGEIKPDLPDPPEEMKWYCSPTLSKILADTFNSKIDFRWIDINPDDSLKISMKNISGSAVNLGGLSQALSYHVKYWLEEA